MSIISSFEAAYSAYNGHQAQMERFWTLRYLQQHQITTLNVTVIKAWPDQPAVVRAETLPLVLTVTAPGLERGQRLRIQLGVIDEIALDVSATVIEHLQTDSDPALEQDDSEEDLTASGPLSVDIDLDAPPSGQDQPHAS